MTTDTVIEKKKTTQRQLKEPSKFKVIFLNDDVTPMEFVVGLIMSVFKHNESEAIRLTMEIHTQGKSVVGIYPFEIAEQKSIDATTLARYNNFPLIIKVESE